MKRWATQVAAIALGLAALTIPTHVPAQGAPPAGAGAKADGRQPLTVDADRRPVGLIHLHDILRAKIV